MGPFPCSDGYDAPRLFDELVPGLAADRDDVVIGCEDQVRQPVVAHELPDVLDGIEFWRSWRQRHQGDVIRDVQFGGQVPARLIEDDHGMGAGIDGSADLSEMRLHRLGVAIGHDQTGTFGLCGTDGAEDVGPFGTLVVRRPRARTALGPSAGELVLLTYAGFVLPPQLNFDAFREFRADLSQLGGEVFLNASSASSF